MAKKGWGGSKSMASHIYAYEWDKIKSEYVTGNMSLRVLSEKYGGIPARTIQKRCKEDGWVAARLEYRKKIVQDAVNMIGEERARETAEKLIDLQKAADSLAGIIKQTMTDADQFHRHIVTEGLGGGATKVECRVLPKVDTKAVRDLSASIKDLTFAVRNLNDLPTVQEKETMRLAAEKLEIDKKKAAVDVKDDAETGVVILAPLAGDPDRSIDIADLFNDAPGGDTPGAGVTSCAGVTGDNGGNHDGGNG
jgi:hypothetical protein